MYTDVQTMPMMLLLHITLGCRSNLPLGCIPDNPALWALAAIDIPQCWLSKQMAWGAETAQSWSMLERIHGRKHPKWWTNAPLRQGTCLSSISNKQWTPIPWQVSGYKLLYFHSGNVHPLSRVPKFYKAVLLSSCWPCQQSWLQKSAKTTVYH